MSEGELLGYVYMSQATLDHKDGLDWHGPFYPSRAACGKAAATWGVPHVLVELRAVGHGGGEDG